MVIPTTGLQGDTMNQLDRRQLLKTTGAGAGIALGAGAASGRSGTVSDAVGIAQNGPATLSPFSATLTQGRLAVDEEIDGEFDDFTDFTGEELELAFDGEVLANGRWSADAEDVTFPGLLELLPVLDLEGELAEFVGEFDLEEDVDAKELFDGLITVLAAMDLDGEAIRDQLDEIITLLTEELLPIGLGIEPIEALGFEGLEEIDGYEEGYTFADWFNEPELPPLLVLVANLDEILDELGDSLEVSTNDLPDGTPDPDDVFQTLLNIVIDFTDFQTVDELQDELVIILEGLDIGELLAGLGDDVQIEIETGGLSGAFDPRLGEPVLVSARIDTLSIVADLGGEFGDSDPFEIDIETKATSGESGAREGSVDFDTGEVTLVENEFVLGLDELDLLGLLEDFDLDDLIGDLDLDELLRDPLTDIISGLLDGDNGDILAVPEDDPADEIVDEIIGLLENFLNGIATALNDEEFLVFLDETVDGVIGELIQDDSGRHAIELDFGFEFNNDPDEFEFDLPSEETTDSIAQDLDNDGTFEDVTGDGEVTIADVQRLFNRLSDINDAGEAGFYNFAGTNGDRATVFDVQALFNRV